MNLYQLRYFVTLAKFQHYMKASEQLCITQPSLSHAISALEKELGIKAGHTTEDLRFTLETVACIGACGLAPVMQVNEDTHGRLTPDKLSAILAKYQ